MAMLRRTERNSVMIAFAPVSLGVQLIGVFDFG